jgi:hypothetical protein
MYAAAGPPASGLPWPASAVSLDDVPRLELALVDADAEPVPELAPELPVVDMVDADPLLPDVPTPEVEPLLEPPLAPASAVEPLGDAPSWTALDASGGTSSAGEPDAPHACNAQAKTHVACAATRETFIRSRRRKADESHGMGP